MTRLSMMTRCVVVCALLPAALMSSRSLAATPGFFALGDLLEAGNGSQALAVSPDGRTVVGSFVDPLGLIAFRWSQSAGLQTVGRIPGGLPPYSEATGVSADGTTVIGVSTAPGTFTAAFKWTLDQGITQLPTLRSSFSPLSFPGGVSADGSVIVGVCSTDQGQRAVRWSDSAGVVNLGLWARMSETQSAGISFDGNCIVGSGRENATVQGFRWRRDSGYRQISDFPGGDLTRLEARTTNQDGSVIVGYGVNANGYEAFVWTEREGLTGLGDLPGGPFESYARAVTPDGSVVVGFGSTVNGYEAFYWTADKRMRRLDAALNEAGVSTAGYRLLRAQGVSADGTIVVGSASVLATGKTIAFVATLPRPAPNADWNRSGVFSTQDIFDYLASWFTGAADFNRDGATDVSDIFDFLSAWFASPALSSGAIEPVLGGSGAPGSDDSSPPSDLSLLDPAFQDPISEDQAKIDRAATLLRGITTLNADELSTLRAITKH